jgi:hypothetical protein
MRQILVERARARGAQKRWGGMNRVTLTETIAAASHEDALLPALDEALSRLDAIDPEQAKIVQAPLLRRAEHRRDRRGARSLAGDRQAALDDSAGVVVPRADQRRSARVTIGSDVWSRARDLFERALEEAPALARLLLERSTAAAAFGDEL